MENQKKSKLVLVLVAIIIVLIIAIAGFLLYPIILEKLDNKADNAVKLDTAKNIELTEATKEKYSSMITDTKFIYLKQLVDERGLDDYTMAHYAIFERNILPMDGSGSPKMYNLEYVKECVKESFEKELGTTGLTIKDDKVELTIPDGFGGPMITFVNKLTFNEETKVYTAIINDYNFTEETMKIDSIDEKDFDNKDINSTYEFKFKELANNKIVVVSLTKIK